MNPATRTLILVNMEDKISAEQNISLLMSDDVDPRREWIDENISFDFEDNFDLNATVEIGEDDEW